jgi:hypothetical protein
MIIEPEHIGEGCLYPSRKEIFAHAMRGDALYFRARTATERASLRGSAYFHGRRAGRMFSCSTVSWDVMRVICLKVRHAS